jgi:hypothetical protein
LDRIPDGATKDDGADSLCSPGGLRLMAFVQSASVPAEDAMSPNAHSAIVVTLVALLTGGQAAAQQPTPPQSVANQLETLTPSERRSATNGALARLADPTTRSVVSGPTPTLVLEANSTSKTAVARIGYQYRDLLIDLKLQGVVDSRTQQAAFADLDGLRHKSIATLGVLWTNYPQRVTSDRLAAACRQYDVAERRTRPGDTCSLREFRALAPNEAGAGAPAGQRQAADELARWLAPRRLFVAGVSYTFGPEQFSFRPTPIAASTQETRVNWAVSARAGLVVSDTLSVGAEYARAVSYRAGDNRQLCVPIGDAGVLECSERVVGGPTRVRTNVVTMELRSRLGPTFAVNPRVSIKPSSGSVQLEVPVYFLQNSTGGLAGGVSIGWHFSRSAGTIVQMTAFAGQVFGLILR